MAEPESQGGRARAAILDAVEAVFAEHRFDGARIDAVANAFDWTREKRS